MTDLYANAAEFASALGNALSLDEFRALIETTMVEGYLNRVDEAWGEPPRPVDERRALARQVIAEGRP